MENKIEITIKDLIRNSEVFRNLEINFDEVDDSELGAIIRDMFETIEKSDESVDIF